MVRSNSSKSSILSQSQEVFSKLQSVDPLSWAVLAVIVVYVAVARPSNTPSIFKNSLFRLVVFVFVAIVFIVEGPMIGTMFALAMILPVIYSNLQNPSEGFNEGITEDEDINDEEDQDDNVEEEI